jgi:transglutaminase-like putative cysteine protease
MMKPSSPSESDARWWDPLAALLLICILLTAGARLVVTEWTDGLSLARNLAVLGAILGLVLGQTRFSPRTALFYGFAYGIFLIPWQLGLALTDDIPWKERLISLGSRLAATGQEFLRSQEVNDNILFLFLMACLFWAFSLYAGYTLTRHANAWRATLPIGFTVIVIQAYDPFLARRAGFLAAILLFSIMLVARMNFIQRRAAWKSKRTYIPPDISYDWVRFTLVVAILIVTVAWTFPILADTMPVVEDVWQEARRPWVELQDRMKNLFGSLQASVGLYREYYSDTFSLGLGSALTEEPILAVKAPPRGFEGVRFYWRAYAYDKFESTRWVSTIKTPIPMGAEEEQFSVEGTIGRRMYSFIFTPQSPMATLFTPSQPLWISREATAYGNRLEGETPDIVTVEAKRPVFRGDAYEVRSSLATITEAELRQAGTDYPQWVIERYLQLPDQITPRTVELALRFRQDLDNPYDIALAVTEYLRTYEYSEIIDAPPPNREVVDWWLFDYGKGFCQYYATSEVILLRILGIPARYAVGYAEGELQDGDEGDAAGLPRTARDENIDAGGVYVVRQRDSHAWPEVYFPGTGWVEFEPTASQLRIFRPSGEPADESSLGANQARPNLPERDLLHELDEGQFDFADETSDQSEIVTNNSLIFLLVLAGLSILLVAVLARKKKLPSNLRTPLPVLLDRGLQKMGVKTPALLRKWIEYASLPPLARSYLEINRALKRLGKPSGVHDTPAERAAALSSLLPEIEEQVYFLLDKYQLSIYSSRIPDIENVRQVGLEIRSKSYRAMLNNFIDRFRWGTHKGDLPSVSKST